MCMPWLSRAKQPGGAPDSDLYGGLVSLGVFFVLWSMGLVNLIRDDRRGYPSWKLSLSCLVFAFSLVVPAIMGFNSVRHLVK